MHAPSRRPLRWGHCLAPGDPNHDSAPRRRRRSSAARLGQGGQPARVDLHHGSERQLVDDDQGVRGLVVRQGTRRSARAAPAGPGRLLPRPPRPPPRSRRGPRRVRPRRRPGPRSGATPGPPRPRPGRRCSRRGCSARGPGRPAAGCPPAVSSPKSPVVSQPSRRQDRGGGGGVEQLVDARARPRAPPPVAAHDGGGAQADPAHRSGRDGPPFVVDDGQLDTGHRAPHREWRPPRRSTPAWSPFRATSPWRCSAPRRARPAGGGSRPPCAAVMRAAPVPATRSAPRSAAGSSALASMSAHCVGTPWATVDALGGQDPHGVVGPPRRRRDDGGDAMGDFVPGPRHVADVGEGQRREPAVARLAQHVGPLGHGGQVGVVEDGTLGVARRAAGPDHRHRVVRREVGPRRRGIALPGRCRLRPLRPRWPGPGRDQGVPGSTTASTGAARSTMEATSAAPMRGLIPDVMAPSRSRAA